MYCASRQILVIFFFPLVSFFFPCKHIKINHVSKYCFQSPLHPYFDLEITLNLQKYCKSFRFGLLTLTHIASLIPEVGKVNLII